MEINNKSIPIVRKKEVLIPFSSQTSSVSDTVDDNR